MCSARGSSGRPRLTYPLAYTITSKGCQAGTPAAPRKHAQRHCRLQGLTQAPACQLRAPCACSASRSAGHSRLTSHALCSSTSKVQAGGAPASRMQPGTAALLVAGTPVAGTPAICLPHAPACAHRIGARPLLGYPATPQAASHPSGRAAATPALLGQHAQLRHPRWACWGAGPAAVHPCWALCASCLAPATPSRAAQGPSSTGKDCRPCRAL